MSVATRPQVREIVVTFDDGLSLSLSHDTYGLHAAIEEWLTAQGYEIVVGTVTADTSRCPKHWRGQHAWEGRRIVGIAFRRCRRCATVQRNLYSTSWEDFPERHPEYWTAPLDPDKGIEACSAADLVPGTRVGWH